MPANAYNWVPDELVEVADEISSWLLIRGYSVKVEKASPGFPFPPTLLATRGKLERVLVEILPDWQEPRLLTWLAYARSCQKELKLCIGVPRDLFMHPSVMTRIRKLGIGILRADGVNTYYEVEPIDASISVSLPPRNDLSPESKVLLGSAYDHFEASRWREGFEEACKLFERSAKKYLKKWVRTGRVQFVTRSGLVAYSDPKINKFTMGALENAFADIKAQNGSDRIIHNALKVIRQDRNKLAHDKWNLRTEKRLRNNVGQHMWVITQALTETFK